MMRLSRRRFLTCLSLLPATLFANAAVKQPTGRSFEPYSKKQLRHHVDRVIGSWQSVLVVGKYYDQATSMTEISPWTTRFIQRLIDSTSVSDRKRIADLQDSYRQRIRQDFRDNRIACVNGYMLSKSESETCWLIHAMLTE